MRKTTFVRTLSCYTAIFCLLELGLICLSAFAQDATPSVAPAGTQATDSAKEALAAALPSDPKELMLLAAKTNGLTGDDVKPWHLRATYKLLDEQGNVKDQGTYEEFWVSPHKFKRTFTGTAFTQTEYGTEKGILVSGAQNPLTYPMVQLRGQFIDPIQSPESIQRTTFDLTPREADSVKLDCLTPVTPEGIHFGTAWCLAAGKSILRASAPQQGAQILHNGIVKFQGRYIAEDLQFIQQAKLVLTAHIDTIELLTTIDEAIFLPPADATPKRITVTISPGVMTGMLLKKVPPEYPFYAKEIGVTGTVVLQATISKDGRIVDLHVVSGPPELQQASLEAVKQWVYRPYLLNNEPVEVKTTINVIFTLGNPPR